MARVVAAVLLAGPAVLLGSGTASGTPSIPAVRHVDQPSGALRMQVLSMSPSSPAISTTPRPFTVRVEVTNTTDEALRHVSFTGLRGNPLETQAALDAALADSTPTADGIEITRKPVIASIAAGAARTITFATATDVPQDAPICLCANGVYPLYFAAHVTASDGTDQLLGATTSFLPSFDTKPAPVRVSWVWPLIDRPHRLASDKVFTDDDLTGLVSDGGRLFRALEVPEQLGDDTALTLVVDPELLDELEVMATGHYSVQVGSKKVAGTGAAAAAAWLARFHALLVQHPNMQVALTPYADPDVQSLSLRRLKWATALPVPMAERVTRALAGRSLDSDFAWPAAGAISSSTLGTLADEGARSIVLDSNSVLPKDGSGGTDAVGLARLVKHSHVITAALTSSAVERYVGSVVTQGTGGTTQLPQLVSEVAIRAAQDISTEHVMVLTAPRYVDPDPATAIQAIRDTSSTPYAKPISFDAATASDRVPDRSHHLAKVSPSATTLPTQVTDAALDATAMLPVVDSLLGGGGPAASTLIHALPVALQRSESSYWRSDPHGGTSFARTLSGQVHGLLGGVHIVSPSSGVYTLASNNSPLPVTVENTLGYRVQVRLDVTTVNQLPGFTATDIGAQTIEAGSKRTLHLPTSIDRSGRIQISAQLFTPDKKHSIGAPVTLSVHSTALGVIGVVITIVAGAILGLALLVRAGRRLRVRAAGRGRSTSGRPARTTTQQPERTP